MNIALVLAGGKGTRFGNEIPKQFIEVNGLPLIVYTLQKFDSCSQIDKIVVVASEEYISTIKSYKDKYGIMKLSNVVLGGETRQASSFNGLESLNANEDDIILIHDAARPMINERIILDNIETCKEYGSAVTAIEVTDTTIDKSSIDVIDRNSLASVQTPQTFKYQIIMEAHQKAKDNCASDDAQLVHKLRHEIKLVKGDKKNIKITTQEDMEYFQYLLQEKR